MSAEGPTPEDEERAARVEALTAGAKTSALIYGAGVPQRGLALIAAVDRQRIEWELAFAMQPPGFSTSVEGARKLLQENEILPALILCSAGILRSFETCTWDVFGSLCSVAQRCLFVSQSYDLCHDYAVFLGTTCKELSAARVGDDAYARAIASLAQARYGSAAGEKRIQRLVQAIELLPEALPRLKEDDETKALTLLTYGRALIDVSKLTPESAQYLQVAGPLQEEGMRISQAVGDDLLVNICAVCLNTIRTNLADYVETEFHDWAPTDLAGRNEAIRTHLTAAVRCARIMRQTSKNPESESVALLASCQALERLTRAWPDHVRIVFGGWHAAAIRSWMAAKDDEKYLLALETYKVRGQAETKGITLEALPDHFPPLDDIRQVGEREQNQEIMLRCLTIALMKELYPQDGQKNWEEIVRICERIVRFFPGEALRPCQEALIVGYLACRRAEEALTVIEQLRAPRSKRLAEKRWGQGPLSSDITSLRKRLHQLNAGLLYIGVAEHGSYSVLVHGRGPVDQTEFIFNPNLGWDRSSEFRERTGWDLASFGLIQRQDVPLPSTDYWTASAALDQIRSHLHVNYVAPILPRVKELGLGRLYLCPGIQLAGYPWHLAGEGPEDFLGAQIEVSFLPAGRFLQVIPFDVQRDDTLVTVLGSTEGLVMTETEARLLGETFPTHQVVDSKRAQTIQQLEALARDAMYLHFVGHGQFRLRKVGQIGESMGGFEFGGQLLRPQDVIQWELSQRPVVMLSFCESGRVNRTSPELDGLPTSFLCAGGRGVFSFAFAFPDEIAPIMMHRLVQGMRSGDHPITALHGVMKWVSATHPQQLLDYARNILPKADVVPVQEFLEKTCKSNRMPPLFWGAIQAYGFA